MGDHDDLPAISVEDGYHYWSKTWDDDDNDVLAIQQGIAQQVHCGPIDARLHRGFRQLQSLRDLSIAQLVDVT